MNTSRKKQIKSLKSQIADAVKAQAISQQSELQLELAEFLKDDDPHSAIQYYEDALQSSRKAQNLENCVLAYQNLADLLILEAKEPRDYTRPFKYLTCQLNVAEELKDPGLIQLAYHTLARYYCTEASQFGNESINLSTALIYARKCIDYLNANARTIDANEKATKTGENSQRRLAGINSVLADIYTKFGSTRKALEHINLSIDYARKHCEKTEPLFNYRCNFVKLDLLNAIKALDLAKEMLNYAKKHKIKENIPILQRNYHILSFTCSPTEGVIKDAIDYFLKQFSHTDSTEHSESALKFFYDYMTNHKKLKTPLSNKEMSTIYENLADLACYAGFSEYALRMYHKMLEYAGDDKERVYLACNSITETARDLRDYKTAIRFQERCCKLVRELYPDDADKRFFDDCDLFFCKVREGYSSAVDMDQQYQDFLALFSKCNTNRKKSVVLDEMILFLAFYGDSKNLERWTDELRKSDELKETERAVDDYSARAPSQLTRNEINTLKSYLQGLQFEEEISDVNWRNKVGETRLHLAAKENNVELVEQLIRSGQDVNAVDNAGWTPLMEAVNHGHLDVVRVLCQKRANLNAASTHGLIDDDGIVGPSGITPLMDACATGNIRIARMLLRFSADVNASNERGDTAADLLRNYIDNTKLSEQDRNMCSTLLLELERKAQKRPSQTNSSRLDISQDSAKRFRNGHNFSA